MYIYNRTVTTDQRFVNENNDDKGIPDQKISVLISNCKNIRPHNRVLDIAYLATTIFFFKTIIVNLLKKIPNSKFNFKSNAYMHDCVAVVKLDNLIKESLISHQVFLAQLLTSGTLYSNIY